MIHKHSSNYITKKIYLVVLMSAFIFFFLSGSVNNVNKNQTNPAGYPIASEVFTTRQRVVVPDITPWSLDPIYPYEIAKYQQNGYGTWHYGAGVDSVKRLDLMPAAYNDASVTPAAKLLTFFTISDPHIVDEESPAQAIYTGYKGGISSGYSPTMLYTTQILDAAVQTINAINLQKPIDFGISLGDSIHNAQYNELRWYIDVMDGKNINPDSGVKDDPVPGPSNDYQDEFKAAGLDKSIPWYQTIAQHDYFWEGLSPISAVGAQSYLGVDILPLHGFYMGSLDGRTTYGEVIGAGPVADFSTPPQVLAADPNRRPLSEKEWMGEFLNTTSLPVGHGYTQTNIDNDFPSYSFEPKSGLPVKVIVLDDSQPADDFDINLEGYLNQARYNWLVSELDQGQSEGKLMIIAAHIPLEMIGTPSTVKSFINAKTLLAKLQTYPNLILWLAGHQHLNAVTELKSPDAAHPELGFWEVETASLKDFPQQFRIIELVRNSDNTLSMFITNIDPAVKDGSLAAISRSYAVAAQQLFKSQTTLLPSGAYNAELVKQLSPVMQTKIKTYGTPLH